MEEMDEASLREREQARMGIARMELANRKIRRHLIVSSAALFVTCPMCVLILIYSIMVESSAFLRVVDAGLAIMLVKLALRAHAATRRLLDDSPRVAKKRISIKLPLFR